MAKYIVQMRRGTFEQWNESDIVPLAGEIVVEIDDVNNLHKLKIGDGIHVYSELAYLQAGDEIVTQILAETKSRLVTITLDVDKWVANPENDRWYYQQIPIDNVTKYSRLDLRPDLSMLAKLNTLGVAFVTENQNGVITAHSIGKKPTTTYIMQASVVETDVSDEVDAIVGAPVTALRKIDAVIDDESDDSIETTWSTCRICEEIAQLVSLSQKGASNGVAELDSNAKVPVSQLPMNEIINQVLQALNS